MLDTRPTAIRLGGAVALAAVLPVVFAAVFLVSSALHRPVLGRALADRSREVVQYLTVVWGIVLLVIAAFQGAGAAIGIGSITSASGLAIRFVFAVLVEAVALGWTLAYLRRTDAEAPVTDSR